MARLITEGFESADTLVFNSLVSTAPTFSTSPARISGYSVTFGNTSAGNFVFTGVSEFYVRFAYQQHVNGGTGVVRWYNGTTELGSLRRNPTSAYVELYTSTGTLVHTGTKYLLSNTWYVIELHVKIADAGGVIEYKIDGVPYAGFTGDTKPGTATTVDKFSIGNISPWSATYDDFALNDTSGSADNSWCGDAHVYGLAPSGNGSSSQFTGSDGNSVDNYLLVDETPSNSDTDYVESATSGHKDLYAFADLPTLPAGSTIKRVIVETRVKELTAAGDSINLGVKSGATEGWSSNIVVSSSYDRAVAEFATNPATSSAWTEAEVNSMEAGVKIV